MLRSSPCKSRTKWSPSKGDEARYKSVTILLKLLKEGNKNCDPTMLAKGGGGWKRVAGNQELLSKIDK